MNDIPDLSALFSMLSANNTDTKNSSFDENTLNSTNSSSDNNIPDMETIMKIMKIMQSTNENSPSKELLKSLKPFLSDSRKSKVDQYIKILGIAKVFNIFNELGGNSK